MTTTESVIAIFPANLPITIDATLVDVKIIDGYAAISYSVATQADGRPMISEIRIPLTDLDDSTRWPSCVRQVHGALADDIVEFMTTGLEVERGGSPA